MYLVHVPFLSNHYLLLKPIHFRMPSERSVYQPNSALAKNAYCSSTDQYRTLYKQSIDNPEEFWGEIAKQFHWETPIDINRFFRYNFDITKGPIYTKWLDGATTNISYNLLDRNIRNGHGDKVAFYWYGICLEPFESSVLHIFRFSLARNHPTF